MLRYALAAVLATAATGAAGVAAEAVPVDGSRTAYPRAVAVPVGPQTVGLKLTGTALRTKLGLFSVYTVASYLQDGMAAGSPDDLIRAEGVKMLHLVMERDVSGKDLLEAFRTAVAAIRPAGTFDAEFAQLAASLGGQTAQKGDHVSLLYVPGTGLRVQLVNKADVTVKGPDFARAVWEAYLGAKPIDESVKRGLVNMLGK
jgi:hypothetical protein